LILFALIALAAARPSALDRITKYVKHAPASAKHHRSSNAQFEIVKPGGATICALGGEYAFLWRQGTSGNLTVFFEGGGACWDQGSCSLPIYTSSVDAQGEADGLNSGDDDFLSNTDSRTPVGQDTILYIPYCTGDVHSGNNTASYGVHHRGRVNVEAALQFIQTKISNPTQVNVVGCSAGSLGAFLNAPFVFEHFPEAVNYRVWGDSEVGILSQAQYEGAWKNWELQLAQWIPGLASPVARQWTSTISGYIIVQAAGYYTNSLWAAYTSDFDLVQSSFYSMGGGTGNWGQLMRDQFKYIYANASNVASYIAPGGAHCVDGDSGYYSVTSSGVSLYEWVQQVFDGTPQQQVDCNPNCL